MNSITITLTGVFATFNDLTQWSGSRSRYLYYGHRKDQIRKILQQLQPQIPLNLPVIPFKSTASIYYEWHTSHRYDLGNLLAAEKLIDDSITKAGIWIDDSQVTFSSHRRVKDRENFIIITITQTSDLQNVGFLKRPKQ